MTKEPIIAVLGAGSSGIAACRALQEQELDFVCFEKGSEIGGLWRFKNDNGQSSAYRSLHINTSKRKMEYDDFPMPDEFPDFPHHEQITEYFESYAQHFDLMRHIRFNQEVVSAEPEGNLWTLKFSDGRQQQFSHLLVANGHHWDPRWPEPRPAGHFEGIETHSHHYIDPQKPYDLIDKNVLVVGMGNSAMDIACELSRKGVARKVWLSARSGVHIMPKYFGSNVLDSFLRHPTEPPSVWERLSHLFPENFRLWLFNLAVEARIRNTVGKPQDFGLPAPATKFHQSHPTISNEIHIRVGSGDLLPKPGIESFNDSIVTFNDGSKESVDAIVWCTGYNIRFPFLDQSILSTEDNDVVLYKRIFHPQYSNLYFIGLVQPLCALMPIAQLQSRLVARHINGAYVLPDKAHMENTMHREYEEVRGNYTKSTRHTIQVNCLEYSWDLNREQKRGGRRKAG